MKNYLFLLLVFPCSITLSAQFGVGSSNPNFKIVAFSHDEYYAPAWKKEDSGKFFYTPQELPAHTINLRNGFGFKDTFNRTLYYHNSKGKMIETQRQQRSGNNKQYTPYLRILNEYNNNGDTTFTLSQNWDAVTGWGNLYDNRWTYDNNHRVITDTTKIWIKAKNSWRCTTGNAYHYNVQGKIDTTYNFSGYPEGPIRQVTRITRTYDNNGNCILLRDSPWDSATQNYTYDWTLDSNEYDAQGNQTLTIRLQYVDHIPRVDYRYSRTYSPTNKQLTSLHEVWLDSVWENSFRDSMYYDAEDNLIREVLYDWQRGSDYWRCLSATTYGYDKNNNMTYEQYDFNNGYNIIQPSERFFYYYEPRLITSVEMPLSQLETSLYPNPGNGIFTLLTRSNTGGTLQVYNMVGENIYTSTFTGNGTQMDISNQPKGLYFYTLQNGNQVIGKGKLVLQ